MKALKILILSLLFIFIVFSLYVYFREGEASYEKKEEKTENLSTYIIDVPIKGRAAILYDISKDRILYGKNITGEYPLASITKIMTTVVLREGLSENETLSLANSDATQSFWKRDDFLSLILVTSSNKAAETARDTFEEKKGGSFVDRMNNKAQELGMEHAYFLNETGLDITGAIGGSYGSALDVVKMMRYALFHHNDLFQKTKSSELPLYERNGTAHEIINTNTFIERFPSPVLSKTGLTDLAGGNLALIFEKEPGHFIAVVVLGSTEKERFTDVEELAWALFQEPYGNH